MANVNAPCRSILVAAVAATAGGVAHDGRPRPSRQTSGRPAVLQCERRFRPRVKIKNCSELIEQQRMKYADLHLVDRGCIYRSLKQYDKAIADHDELIRQDPSYARTTAIADWQSRPRRPPGAGPTL
ncbi:tetratricopeptide (TPR) repeat protein [Bradyrhizobium sp. LB1.3]